MNVNEVQEKQESELMTLAQAQSFLGVKSRKTILKYIKSGKLTAYKLGGTRWRITKLALEAFLRS